jgi:inward rectifier potassium channel
MAPPSFDPGLTQKYTGKISRIINPDGSFNVRRTGRLWQQLHLYQWLTSISWPAFFGTIVGTYVLLNLIFAGLYLLIGIEHLRGAQGASGLENFGNAYFFSFQTFTTVGYGAIAPGGVLASALAAVEAMIGILTFALITGIFYGRFTKPSAKILFSRNVLVAPYREGTSLQFRVVNQRANMLLEVEATVILMTVDRSSPILKRNYVPLKLELPRVNFLTLTWTLVHAINETSPLWQKGMDELRDAESEVIVQLKAYDESYGDVVYARYSYRAEEIVYGARFLPAFTVDDNGEIVIELEKHHNHERLEMPA